MSGFSDIFEQDSGVISEFKSFLVKSKKDKEKQLDKNLSKLLDLHIKKMPVKQDSLSKITIGSGKKVNESTQIQIPKDLTQADKVNNLLQSLKKKMRLTKNTRDIRFENKMKDFHNIYSFFDVRKFLVNMNLVNKEGDINTLVSMMEKEGTINNNFSMILGEDLIEDSDYEASKEYLAKEKSEKLIERANKSVQEASAKRHINSEKFRNEVTEKLLNKENLIQDVELDLLDPRFDEILLAKLRNGEFVANIEEKKKTFYRDPAKEKAQISELEKVIKSEMGFLSGKDFNEEVIFIIYIYIL
jgi:predicted nucleic acid-binding protein